MNYWANYKQKYKNAKIDVLEIFPSIHHNKDYKGEVGDKSLLGNMQHLTSIEIHEHDGAFKHILEACLKGQFNDNLMQLKLFVRSEVQDT